MIETVGELIELLSECDPSSPVYIPRYSQDIDENGEWIDTGLEWVPIESVNDLGDRVDIELGQIGEQFDD